jgi:hypothetical protein
MNQESEKVTRKNRIDLLLKAAGWRIVKFSDNMDPRLLQNYAIEELLTGANVMRHSKK